MPTITGPILDSSGRLASGLLRARASRPFDVGTGHITQAMATATIRNGQPFGPGGEPWSLPPTPEGVTLRLEADLDGHDLAVFNVVVLDVPAMTYSQLLFNRGVDIGLGPEPYVWLLEGGADFPPQAHSNDVGYDPVTGNLWRNS